MKKTIIFDKKTAKKIEYISNTEYRDFSNQIRFIVSQYLDEYDKSNTKNKKYQLFLESLEK